MNSSYVLQVGENFVPEYEEKIMPSLFKEYERVLIESIVTSFGLDFIVKDRHGGDVDTIHNVRQIDKDPLMAYKNSDNQSAYDNRSEYNHGHAYRSDSTYINRGRADKAQQQNSTLHDAYRGENIAQNENRQLDHIISASEVHNDRGRSLANLNGVDLANAEENLQSTHGYINNIKSNYTTEDFIKNVLPHKEKILKERISQGKEKLATMPSSTPEERHKKELLEHEIQKNENNLTTLKSIDRQGMAKADKKARKAYEQKIARAYYSSPQFMKDTAIAAGKVGVAMGVRQTLGFVFTEIWFAVKEEFAKSTGEFSFEGFLTSMGEGIKRGYENAKKKYKELFAKFLSGSMAGALSSLTTTLCNMFFTTAKNAVRILRQAWGSIVEALKVLFINPENYEFGERMRAVAKILATGASIVVGTFISEAVAKLAIANIPVVGEIIPAFIGSFATGIMTCTLLHFLDKNQKVNDLVNWLNKFQTIDGEVRYYQQQAKFFEEYAAQLLKIDLKQFQKEVKMYGDAIHMLDSVSSEKDMNTSLLHIYDTIGVKIPWEGSFDNFMTNKKATLVFS